jgi:TatA/E family protein of Tat protein translocase
MFGHLPELLIIMVVALIVFGPEKLPEVAGTVGRTVRDLRQAFDDAMHPEEEPVDFDAYYREYEGLHPNHGGTEPGTPEGWPGVGETEGVETAVEEHKPAAESESLATDELPASSHAGEGKSDPRPPA